MSVHFIAFAALLVFLITLPLYRVVRGPTTFDRIIAAGLIGTKGILILCLIGFAYKRIDMFIDLAVVYALLNFVGTVATAKYFERKGEKDS